jgi:hypothetical protein
MHRLTIIERYDDAGMLCEIRDGGCQHGRACISVADGLDECEHHISKGAHHYCTEDCER